MKAACSTAAAKAVESEPASTQTAGAYGQFPLTSQLLLASLVRSLSFLVVSLHLT